ncbi:TPA: conjugal transfer protein TraH, partial [Providencia alcalifaciens]
MCSALFCHSVAVANVNQDLNNFFNKLGFEGNATDARAWQSQAAGYATGGNLFLRNQTKSLQIASFTPPSINAGCGGIDAYLGSFSFINGEQITQLVKQIMTNGAGYLFDLALQTTVPELKSAKDFIQDMANSVNSMNISSCQAAQGIIGGLWPTNTVQSQKICQDIAGETNMFADWAASRQGCTVGGKMDQAFANAPENMKDQIM